MEIFNYRRHFFYFFQHISHYFYYYWSEKSLTFYMNFFSFSVVWLYVWNGFLKLICDLQFFLSPSHFIFMKFFFSFVFIVVVRYDRMRSCFFFVSPYTYTCCKSRHVNVVIVFLALQ